MEKSRLVVSPLRNVCIKESKEDAFFDAKPWLDSELEDDFFSVNVDFTPTGSPAPSTEVNRRKKLREHFRESIIWEGGASDDGDSSRMKPITHVLLCTNKSRFESPKRPTSAQWILKEEGSKSGRSSQMIRRCLERFSLCRTSR